MTDTEHRALGSRWIRLEASSPRDPKIIALAADLELDPMHAFGHVVATWCAIGEHAPDGDLAQASDLVLETWAGWRGERARFARAFRSAFMRGDSLPSWAALQGKLVALATKDRERKKLPPRSDQHGSTAEAPRNLHGTSTVTVRDETKQNETEVPTPTATTFVKRKPRASRATRAIDRASSPSSWVDEAVSRWAQNIGVVPHGRMGSALKQAVEMYGEAAVLAAVSAFGEWFRRRIHEFDDKIPGLPYFVANIRSHIPHNLLGDVRPDGAEGELLQPAAAAWENVYGPGSFDRNTAARELAPIHAAGLSPDQIARRLAFYLAQKGSETVLPADQLARRHFTPSLRDFRQRHAAFDPDALEAA